MQRRSGEAPLTVAVHVEDLCRIIERHAAGGPVALVGASWGAMLALAFAAMHPSAAAGLVLAGVARAIAAYRCLE